MDVLLVLLSYLSGSLPFSVWTGRLLAREDIRQFGDGNPGATNALKAGGWQAGILALILDVLKGALPVGLAYFVWGVRGTVMYLIALAPTIGHAYPPFLKWQGGKALAVSLGVWIGLSLYEIPLVALLLLLLWFAILSTDAWAVILMISGVLLYILMLNPQPLWISICISQFILIIWKHRQGLSEMPALRPWIIRLSKNRS